MNRLHTFSSLVCLFLCALPLGCANIESSGEDPGEAREAVAGETLDREFAPAPTATRSVKPTEPLAQVFSVRHSGQLTRVSLNAPTCDPALRLPCGMTVRLKALNGNLPGVELASASVQRPLPQPGVTSAWIDVNFTAAPAVAAQGSYVIEITPGALMTMPIASGYTGGALMQLDSGFGTWSNLPAGNGFLFRTWVLEPPPVLGIARCGYRIRLRSWKGDYLHRPDSPQGVTTWNVGIGNEWTLECVGNGHIQLRSWKGDYLHRPDSPQGVTTYSFGEWTPETLANGNVQIRSWKGDYLHRPDSPQGVTTYSFGEWAVEEVQ